MKHDEQAELMAILLRQLLDAVALNQYYAALLRPLLKGKPTPKTWSQLSQIERDAFTDAALKQAQAVFTELGWGLDVQHLKGLATA